MMSRVLPMVALVASLGIVTACQTDRPASPYDGRNLYLGYCAACHGPDGAGDGPVAPALAHPMEDLRTLTIRNGAFPRDWLVEMIDGRTLRAAHGSREMPVWGWRFYLEEDSRDNVSARIEALVDYLRDIQRSSAQGQT